MQIKPPAPADIGLTFGLTFALSHLEDSPLEFLLITLDRDKENDNEASIGIDMRVSDREVLQLMVNKMLQAIEALDEKPVGREKK